MPKFLYPAAERGFCAGVRRALGMVDTLLASGRRPLYVYHEIVHNNFVVEALRMRGVCFVDRLSAVPDHAVLIFSAHGVSVAVEREARTRNLEIVDATCLLVRELHREAARALARGDLTILIGHRRHPEVEGTLGQGAPGAIRLVENADDAAGLPELKPGQNAFYLTQTTLNSGEVEPLTALLRRRYPKLTGGSGICYATAKRQQAVRELVAVKKVQGVIVIGSPKSSNSKGLCEVARRAQVEAWLIDDPEELRTMALAGYGRLGITAGASAPEDLLKRAITILSEKGYEYSED